MILSLTQRVEALERSVNQPSNRDRLFNKIKEEENDGKRVRRIEKENKQDGGEIEQSGQPVYIPDPAAIDLRISQS